MHLSVQRIGDFCESRDQLSVVTAKSEKRRYLSAVLRYWPLKYLRDLLGVGGIRAVLDYMTEILGLLHEKLTFPRLTLQTGVDDLSKHVVQRLKQLFEFYGVDKNVVQVH